MQLDSDVANVTPKIADLVFLEHTVVHDVLQKKKEITSTSILKNPFLDP